MALAIECINNLILHHLSYVSTLLEITQDIDELKQRLIDTWDRIPQGIIDKGLLTRGKHGCVHA